MSLDNSSDNKNLTQSNISNSLPEISTSKFSEQEYERHFQAVLQADGHPLEAKDVRHAWSTYLELMMEPAGWRAVLIPSPDTASVLNMESGRKGSVLVDVVDVLFDDLEAEVELLHPEMEDKVVNVPVDELYPVKKQDFESLNMQHTAMALDLIRFFYKNIWMPWDEDSDCHDWPVQHLANRIHLHFCLMSGNGDHATATRLDELKARAELNSTALLELEDMASIAEESVGDNNGDLSCIGRMYELHQEQESIRREAEMLENPTLRMAVEAKTTSLRKLKRKEASSSLLIVWNGGNLSKLSSLVQQLHKEFSEDSNVLVYPDLQHAIDVSVANDVVIIASQGEHVMRSLGGLASGGRILSRGCSEGSVTIVPGDTSAVFCEVQQGSLEMSDVKIDLKNVNVGFAVNNAELCMNNVTILGGSTAVLVGARGNFKMKNGKVSESGIGLEISPDSNGCLENCVLERNRISLSVKEAGHMKVKNSYVGKNDDYGLVLHCVKSHEGEGIWSGEQAVSKAGQRGVHIQSTEFGGNSLGDVAILELNLDGIHSPSVDKRSHLTRRFSTPMSGKSQTSHGLDSKDSPIFHSLSRVLTYPE